MGLRSMFRQKHDDKYAYNQFLTYMILCRNLENCRLALDSIKKQYRNDIFIHEPVSSDDPTVKRADYIVDVANNQLIRKKFEEQLNPYVKSFDIF